MRRWPRSSRCSTAWPIPVRWSESTRLARTSAGSSRSTTTTGMLELAEQRDRRLVALPGHREDEAVDAPLLEEPHVTGVEVGIGLRVGQQHRVALVAKGRLGARHDLGQERVGDVADHEPDREGLAAAEPLGQQVRLVGEPVDGLEDAVAHLGAHVGMAREHARHRGHGDSGQLGDLAHARPAGRPSHVLPQAASRCRSTYSRSSSQPRPGASESSIQPSRSSGRLATRFHQIGSRSGWNTSR